MCLDDLKVGYIPEGIAEPSVGIATAVLCESDGPDEQSGDDTTGNESVDPAPAAETAVENQWVGVPSPQDDALALYFQDIASISLLTTEEELALGRQIACGKAAEAEMRASSSPSENERRSWMMQIRLARQAREKLIQANSRLVVHIAKKYRHLGVPLLDLIQEGNIGLLRAVDRFDYRRGYKFSTYATWWIRQAILRAIPSQGRTIRLPIYLSERVQRLTQTFGYLSQRLGREPSLAELAEEMQMPSAKVRRLMRLSQKTLSLEAPVGKDQDAHLGDLIEDTDTPSIVDAITRGQLEHDVKEAMNCLNAREQKVLQLRYGLGGSDSLSLEELGRRFGVTRERVRQIEIGALRKLRQSRQGQRLRSHLE